MHLLTVLFVLVQLIYWLWRVLSSGNEKLRIGGKRKHLSAACGGTSPQGEAVGEASLEGENGEAPPAAEKASRFRGSGAIGGLARDRESLCRDGAAVSEAD